MNTRPGGDFAISPQDAGVCGPGRVSNNCGTPPPRSADTGDMSGPCQRAMPQPFTGA